MKAAPNYCTCSSWIVDCGCEYTSGTLSVNSCWFVLIWDNFLEYLCTWHDQVSSAVQTVSLWKLLYILKWSCIATATIFAFCSVRQTISVFKGRMDFDILVQQRLYEGYLKEYTIHIYRLDTQRTCGCVFINWSELNLTCID